MNDKKLFAVMLGGRAEGCNIEMHDITFVVGSSLEDTYPSLVRKWFGTTKGVHIDASLELDIVDGYQISLSKATQADLTDNKNALYFTNFGGYQENFFGELHEIGFYVADSKKSVVRRAKQELCVGTLQQHCDDNFIIGSKNLEKKIDDVIKISAVDGYQIHLSPTTEHSKAKVEAAYRRLDIPAVLEI